MRRRAYGKMVAEPVYDITMTSDLSPAAAPNKEGKLAVAKFCIGE